MKVVDVVRNGSREASQLSGFRGIGGGRGEGYFYYVYRCEGNRGNVKRRMGRQREV